MQLQTFLEWFVRKNVSDFSEVKKAAAPSYVSMILCRIRHTDTFVLPFKQFYSNLPCNVLEWYLYETGLKITLKIVFQERII